MSETFCVYTVCNRQMVRQKTSSRIVEFNERDRKLLIAGHLSFQPQRPGTKRKRFMAVTKGDSRGHTTVSSWLQSEAAKVAPNQQPRWEPEISHWTTPASPALSSLCRAGGLPGVMGAAITGRAGLFLHPASISPISTPASFSLDLF